MAEVADIINDLYKFTAFIRKSGSATDDERASWWAEEEGERLEKELQELEKHASRKIRDRYPKLSQNYSTLRGRIIHAIIQRRRRLLCRVSHLQKVERTLAIAQVHQILYEVERQGSPQEHIYESGSCNDEPASASNQEKTEQEKAVYAISPSPNFLLENLNVTPPPKPGVIGIPETICPYCVLPLGSKLKGKGKKSSWT